ncbi:MAG: peptidoglycan D,D-transpeptidase FtsI family protein [Phycisphaeraceae bacterium JB051]
MRITNPIRRLVPSMFHRRLLLLVLMMIGGGTVLTLRMSYMTLVQASQWQDLAEQRLVRRQIIPTVRGRILDRQGRVLATDAPAYDVAVHYEVISDQWPYKMARRQARSEHRSQWYDLSKAQREAFIKECMPTYQTQQDQMWQLLAALGNVDPMQITEAKAGVLAKVARLKSYLWSRWRQKREEETGEQVSLADVATDIMEERDFHSVVFAITPPNRLQLQKLLTEALVNDQSIWNKVRLVDSTKRSYPLDEMSITLDRSHFPTPLQGGKQPMVDIDVSGVGTHLIGNIRRLWKQDKLPPFWEKDDDGNTVPNFAGYQHGDKIGAWGIEKEMEDALRGERGQRKVNLETGDVQMREPVPGQDVKLTVDIQLQARIQALMSRDQRVGLMRQQFWHAKDMNESEMGRPLNGAAVVLEVNTGQVLAAVSVPGYSRKDLKEKPMSFWRSNWAKTNQPLIYRPIAMSYPPGSTMKPIILAAAYSAGVHQLGHAITCDGALDMDHPTRNRCWIFKQNSIGHGPLIGHEAICVSCNVFFYTIGQKFGLEKLTRWYGMLGIGQPTNCGLTPEHAGYLPKLDAKGHIANSKLGIQDAIQMGIGQGPVEWTPLQCANVYSTLARNGLSLQPTFVLSPANLQESHQIKLDAAGRKDVLRGMYESVNDRRGSSNHLVKLNGEKVFNIPDVTIRGKTGTATPPARWIDDNNDSKIQSYEVTKSEDLGDHAWFVGMVYRKNESTPAFIVAVVVEYAGSGGAVSGPIANQIFWALRQEGYL